MEVCIDSCDPALIASFWSELLGYRIEGDITARWVHLEPPRGLPVLNLQRVPEAKKGKNRLHFDLYVESPADCITRSESLGATRVRLHDDPSDWFHVMADPEGNEFCICRERSQQR
jgi:Glyoxalase-like domain